MNIFKKFVATTLVGVAVFIPHFRTSPELRNVTAEDPSAVAAAASSREIQLGSRLWELLFKKSETKDLEKKEDKDNTILLLTGGDVFGARVKQSHITVSDPEGTEGIKCGDILISINDTKPTSIEDVKKTVAESEGEALSLVFLRGKHTIRCRLTPKRTEDGKYELGIGLRDGAAGIGTITYIDPKTGMFGGLGHGISDSESGQIIDIKSGTVTDVILGGVQKGECGKPGELCGILTDRICGQVYANTEVGIFGRLDSIPTNGVKEIKVATRDQIHEGKASILCTLKNGLKSEYSIEIFDIDKGSSNTKSFKIRVTDKALQAISGGIVRGMSGSPIIQDGKLIGAVTHVMVNDPTEGYGIFIENMLNAAQNQVVPKAA